MSETPNIENKIITTDDVVDTSYVPSGVEKKRAVMMYLLFGIIIAIANKKVNVYEYFHLKQSIWRWLCFILVVILSVGLLLFPGVKYLGLLAMLIMVIFFIIFVNQARKGKYKVNMVKYGFGFFPSLGVRVVNLFEIWPTTENIQTSNQAPVIKSEPIATNIDQIVKNEGIAEQVNNIKDTLK